MFTRPENLTYGSPEVEAYYRARRADCEFENIRVDHTSFGNIDAKGRVHGYQVAFSKRTYTRIAPDRAADKSGVSYIDNENLGTWFYVTPHATKDGKTFGACQPGRPFRTMEKAEAEAAAMIERARKASLKKY